MSIFRDGLPGLTDLLVQELDSLEPRAVLESPEDLDDPEARRDFLIQYGRRDLVDQLVNTLSRQKKKLKENTQ